MDAEPVVEPLLERSINPDSVRFEDDLARDSSQVAKKFNMHKHTFTCWKYRSGSKSCRFGAPWKVIPETYCSEEGVVNLKRNEAYLNKWNPLMASLLRCNHDISFIPTQSGFLGLVYYITDYATKLAKPIYHYFSIAAAMMSSQTEQMDEREDRQTDVYKSRQFLNKVYNKISVSREISGPEIGNVLIGQPECYTNVKFTNLNYNSLYFEMISTFPNLRVENQVENGDENVEPTVRIIDERTALDQFVDYRYRGETLKGLCLYDYKSIVFRRALTSIEKEKGDVDRCARFS